MSQVLRAPAGATHVWNEGACTETFYLVDGDRLYWWYATGDSWQLSAYAPEHRLPAMRPLVQP